MGYFRLSEDRHSWKSSQQSTASAANRSFSEDGMFSVFSLAPFGHSSVTPLPVWNISAGFPVCCTLLDKRTPSSEGLKRLRPWQNHVENANWLALGPGIADPTIPNTR